MWTPAARSCRSQRIPRTPVLPPVLLRLSRLAGGVLLCLLALENTVLAESDSADAPPPAAAPAETESPEAASPEEVRWRKDYAEAIRESERLKRPVVLQFTAPWCVQCRRMFAQTWRDARIVKQMNKEFIALVVDAEEHARVAKELQVQALPTTIIVSADRKTVKRLAGYQTADELRKQLAAFQREMLVLLDPRPHARLISGITAAVVTVGPVELVRQDVGAYHRQAGALSGQR
jgi:thiol:disulfide interchange protein